MPVAGIFSSVSTLPPVSHIAIKTTSVNCHGRIQAICTAKMMFKPHILAGAPDQSYGPVFHYLQPEFAPETRLSFLPFR